MPERIAGHRLLERIGEGGMGAVFRVEKGGRELALKVLTKGAIGLEAAVRFEREAELAARLRHPNILTIHGAGRDPATGQPWISAELAQPQALSHRIAARKGEPWPLDEAIALLAPIAAAVDALHAAGVVHRDLKPQNILFHEDGRPLVADFGLARARDSVALTATGQVVGTPAYMSPETLGHEEPAPAADRWAFAVIAYELVAGTRPFQGQGWELGRAILEGRRAAPAASAPSDLDRVFDRAFAAASSERFETCAALVEALTVAPSSRASQLPALAVIALGLGAGVALCWGPWAERAPRLESVGAEGQRDPELASARLAGQVILSLHTAEALSPAELGRLTPAAEALEAGRAAEALSALEALPVTISDEEFRAAGWIRVAATAQMRNALEAYELAGGLSRRGRVELEELAEALREELLVSAAVEEVVAGRRPIQLLRGREGEMERGAWNAMLAEVHRRLALRCDGVALSERELCQVGRDCDALSAELPELPLLNHPSVLAARARRAMSEGRVGDAMHFESWLWVTHEQRSLGESSSWLLAPFREQHKTFINLSYEAIHDDKLDQWWAWIQAAIVLDLPIDGLRKGWFFKLIAAGTVEEALNSARGQRGALLALGILEPDGESQSWSPQLQAMTRLDARLAALERLAPQLGPRLGAECLGHLAYLSLQPAMALPKSTRGEALDEVIELSRQALKLAPPRPDSHYRSALQAMLVHPTRGLGSDEAAALLAGYRSSITARAEGGPESAALAYNGDEEPVERSRLARYEGERWAELGELASADEAFLRSLQLSPDTETLRSWVRHTLSAGSRESARLILDEVAVLKGVPTDTLKEASLAEFEASLAPLVGE